jgi:F-type H+-transporting ATPase subunit delta
MKRVPRSVARRYARALLDIAIEQGKAGALVTQLKDAVALVEQQPDLRRALEHPALPLEKKKAIVSAVWPKAEPLFLRLLELLIERGRLPILPALYETFVELTNEHRGVVAAQALSAQPLAPVQKDALALAAKKLVGREVALTIDVDPALLGGVVLRMAGRTYDGSLRAQLRLLRERLASGIVASSSSPRT